MASLGFSQWATFQLLCSGASRPEQSCHCRPGVPHSGEGVGACVWHKKGLNSSRPVEYSWMCPVRTSALRALEGIWRRVAETAGWNWLGRRYARRSRCLNSTFCVWEVWVAEQRRSETDGQQVGRGKDEAEMDGWQRRTKTLYFLEGKDDPWKMMWLKKKKKKKSAASECAVSKRTIFSGRSSRKRQLVVGNGNRERRRREIKSEAALIC